MLRAVLAAVALAGYAAAFAPFAPAGSVLPKAVSARAAIARGPSMQERFPYKTSCGYDIKAPYWAENGGVFGWADVIWAREAEVNFPHKHLLGAGVIRDVIYQLGG